MEFSFTRLLYTHYFSNLWQNYNILNSGKGKITSTARWIWIKWAYGENWLPHSCSSDPGFYACCACCIFCISVLHYSSSTRYACKCFLLHCICHSLSYLSWNPTKCLSCIRSDCFLFIGILFLIHCTYFPLQACSL